MVARDCGGDEWGAIANRNELCLFVFLVKLGDKNVLKVDSGDGCMTL